MAKDLLKLQRAPDLHIRALLRPAVFVPESKGLNDLLREFRGNRNHLAIVIDEFGRVAGLVTIEDVLEQIVGEIEDEFDGSQEDSGDIFGLADRILPRERRHARSIGSTKDSGYPSRAVRRVRTFDTIGGLIAHEMGHVPQRGEHLQLCGLHFVVMHTSGGAVRWFKVLPRCAYRGSRIRLPAPVATKRHDFPIACRTYRLSAAGLVRPAAGLVRSLALGRHGVVVAAAAGAGAGGLAAGRFVPPFGTPRRRFRHGFRRGWLLATVWLASTFWWLYISMHVYGGMLAWLSALAVLLLVSPHSPCITRWPAVCGWRCRGPGVREAVCCLPRSGCWPNFVVACCLPGSPGARWAMPMWKARWPAGHPGWASTASASWPAGSRPCWPCASCRVVPHR